MGLATTASRESACSNRGADDIALLRDLGVSVLVKNQCCLGRKC